MLIDYLKLQRRYGLWQTQIDPRTVVYRRRKNEWPAYVKRWPLLACPGRWDISDTDYAPFRRQLKESALAGDVLPDNLFDPSALSDLFEDVRAARDWRAVQVLFAAATLGSWIGQFM